jgi:tetratricopeptide (TPR) repeat protein
MKADTMTDLAIVYKDRFDVGGRDFLVFSALEPGNDDAAVEGWTYAPPASLSEGEQWRSRTISLAPLKALAFVAYQRDNNEEALAWCDRVAKAKPLDNDLTPLRTELYARTGKSDEAMANLKAEIERNPANTGNRVQYAGMLMNQERFEDAIAQYEAVLKAEPNNETALFNMAAVYKNRAVKAQMAERAKQQADRKYQPDESYMKDLGTSADYFVKLRQNFKYRDDLTVLEQLANIYEVRREKVRVKEIIMELEALREKYANDRKYYQIMEGVYARNGMEDKAKEMEQKLGTMK